MRNFAHIDEDIANGKVIVCHCQQCKFAKNKRKNRKYKKKIKRMMNRKLRKDISGKFHIFYWA